MAELNIDAVMPGMARNLTASQLQACKDQINHSKNNFSDRSEKLKRVSHVIKVTDKDSYKGRIYSIPANQFKVDDMVLVRIPHISQPTEGKFHKFFHLFKGPYKISRVIAPNAFELQKEDKRLVGVFNAAHLKPFKTPLV